MNSKSEVDIRLAIQSDLPEIVALINGYIRDTPITFDLEPYEMGQRQEWFDHYHHSGPHQLLVAVSGGELLGYACSSEFKAKAAYQTSVEVSVYLQPSAAGNGLGTQLYAALFERLKAENVHRAYGAITQPNEASNALHIAFGFKSVGYLTEVGWKQGQYWDVEWYEKALNSS